MLSSLIFAMAATTQVPADNFAVEEEATIDVVAQQARQPAVLINRGMDLALQGRVGEARALFETVKAMKVDYTLETSDGRWVYPPDLARLALKRLDRGEFRSAALAKLD